MEKRKTGEVVLWTVGILAVVAGGYLLFTKVIAPPAASGNSPISKEDEVVGILSNSGGTGCYNFLMSLDNGFIASWYNAVKSKKPTFTSGNGNFCTVTGKAI